MAGYNKCDLKLSELKGFSKNNKPHSHRQILYLPEGKVAGW